MKEWYTSIQYAIIVFHFQLKVGQWRIVAQMPLGVSDHCSVLLNDTHALLNSGAIGYYEDIGNTYIFDSIKQTFTKGIRLLLNWRIQLKTNQMLGICTHFV